MDFEEFREDCPSRSYKTCVLQGYYCKEKWCPLYYLYKMMRKYDPALDHEKLRDKK